MITLSSDLAQELVRIDGGDIFYGTWQQLDDCFGVTTKEELKHFCFYNDYALEIIEPVIH